MADRTGVQGTERGDRVCAVLIVVLALSAAACARLPYAPKSGVEIGVASWYGQEFHGRPTSSREVFDMNDMTAAHRTLPFGTYVMVTDLAKDRSVVVRINDRGPFVRGRIIDLSYAAARVLGIVGPGTARVRLDILGGLREPVPTSPLTWIQVGAFSAQENAYALKKRLEKTYPGVVVSTLKTGNGAYYRVRVRTDGDSADALASRLAGEGFLVILIRE
ncbi:MAG: septal ring lytic transglycosylase RlpA family protein [Candidatus Aminicenantes bacterium]|nr:septal ring lytic transglycosylase RlpA family protein [Candidatus Aminicenantes bacterium]